MVDTPRASKVSHLNDHPLPNQYVLRLEVAMENSLDVHNDKRLDYLLENP